ncbi:anti-ECFsigma factor, ChrR [[Leptolyngbya] sp. PCC 7376]|uniref:cupin domain-containing protein n=1 Tax=[Leptolyngbya] sp. PCC 7376 TaxID=111781 RepID=UPI00029EE500|nr:cupin domain-containing protein [[Leptolyngbya] sp. PCC 7376]AFY40672.1 anti-ECFsigma factor, ChrR [[Leptolyngbya] sp. PCC 7376]
MSSNPIFPDKNQDAEELAALYALDVLEIEERDQVRQAIADSDDFAQTVSDLSDAAAAIAYDLPSIPMSDTLKGRLFQRIAQDTVNADSELYRLLRLSIDELKKKSETVTWKPMSGNTADAYTATLETDEVHQKVALFVKANHGGHFPMHIHDSGETLLMLTGDLIIDGLTYTAGDRIDSTEKSIHQPETLNGCLVLCISSLNDALI